VARPAPAPSAPPAPQPTQQEQVIQQTETLDTKREEALLPKTGSDTYQVTSKDIENKPQGGTARFVDVLQQTPGVSKDSSASGDYHVRNEHGNIQYRINGILLPEGVSGFGSLIGASLIGQFQLITGALPAQYGLRTAGVVDITAKSGAALSGGSVGVYGGSRQTITNTFEYGGVTGKTDYFVNGQYNSTGLGLENPTASLNAIHDHSEQGRFFGYTSTLLDPDTRLTSLTGLSLGRYQIPTNPGQPINPSGFSGPGGAPFTAFGIPSYDSRNINENQYEKNAYGVLAWQHSGDSVDMQLAYYSRYSELHFVPDPVGDILFNGVASDVFRSTFVNGIQSDNAIHITEVQTIRVGGYVNGEQTRVKTLATLEATDPTLTVAFEPPFTITDGSNKFGWLLGGYIQDEIKLTEHLTLNVGVRFDQMFQYVTANQFSPRASITYKPYWGTVIHTGYARYFTPPPQDLGRTVPTIPFTFTTNAPFQPNFGSIQPERAHVVDAGLTQQLLPPCPTGTGGMFTKAPAATTNCPSLEVGVDIYYKYARDLLDDGQFGAAYVLTAFNYDKAENWGMELSAKASVGNFTAYTNWAFQRQHAHTFVSNQALFATIFNPPGYSPPPLPLGPGGLAQYDYVFNHWINTDHSEATVGSAGVSYNWDGNKFIADMIYGSGLRTGFANTDHLPAYWQLNMGVSREFMPWGNTVMGLADKPMTVRFDVVNVLDTVYAIRNGSGIGVFAPQFGPRRAYFVGVSQKL
jgi:outer membrane receptor protein involved in Fe transport